MCAVKRTQQQVTVENTTGTVQRQSTTQNRRENLTRQDIVELYNCRRRTNAQNQSVLLCQKTAAIACFFLSTYANMPQEEKTSELQNKHMEITV
jgi:hypothetical protein